MKKDTLAALNNARDARKCVALLTRLDGSEEHLIEEGDTIGAAFIEPARAAFKSGKSASFEIDGQTWFINVHLPPVRLVVIGAVHISQHLAVMARQVGFDIMIIDPRTAFATPERFGEVEMHAEWPMDVLNTKPLDQYTAMIAVTHDPKIDDDALCEAIKRNCFYIGALGSRKTHAKRLQRLADREVSQSDLEKICAPIGLNIAAANPAEIAVSILAQVIETLRKREVGGI